MATITKRAIAAAFLEIAQEKPIDKVTVKDVVNRCGITRQTFYYHFQDLLDVVEWLVAQKMEALLAETLAAETPQAAIRVLLSVAEGEQLNFLERLLHSRKREEAERIFYNAARTYFAKLMRQSPHTPTLKYAGDMDVALTFYSSAFVGVLLEASSKPDVDLDLLAEQLLRFLNGEAHPK